MSDTHIPPPPVHCTGCLYTVKPGDSLYQIAMSHGICLQQIIAANPQIPNPDLIYPGQKVCVPAPAHRTHCLVLKPEKEHCHCRKMTGLICMQEMDDGETQVMVMASNAPDPRHMGHDCYFCHLSWEGGCHEIRMEQVMEDPVFFGFRRFPFIFPRPFFAGGLVRILPGPILVGVFI